MRIITSILLLLISMAGVSQVQHQPDELWPQNRAGWPVRDTTGAGRPGEHRTRPQDGRTYYWAHPITRWIRYIDVTDTTGWAGGGGGGATYTGSAPISISGGNVISISAAGNSADGYITTGTQNIAGLKTFTAAGLNVAPSVTNTAAYYQINNTGGNFQFILTPSSGYTDYGIFTENTGGLYTSATNGMAFISDGSGTPGSYKWAFGTNSPAMELLTTGLKLSSLAGNGNGVISVDNTGKLGFTTVGSSQWSTVDGNHIKYSAASSAGMVEVTAPSGSGAAFQASNFSGVDARLQSNVSDAFAGTVTNHDFYLVANNSERLRLPAAGGFQVTGKSSFSDTSALAARFSYNSNIASSFTQYSLVHKRYVDSLVAAGGGGTTLYSGNGTLSGNRIVSGAGNDLKFDNLDEFRINGNTLVQSNTLGTKAYSSTIINLLDTQWRFGFSPIVSGNVTFNKGAAIAIDTNNNIGLGQISASATMPLYGDSDGGVAINGLLSTTGNFYRVAVITGNTTLTNQVYFCTVDATSGNITITLPAASSVFGGTLGIKYAFKRLDNSGNTITIQRAGSDTIDGGTSFTLTSQYESKSIIAISTSAWALF